MQQVTLCFQEIIKHISFHRGIQPRTVEITSNVCNSLKRWSKCSLSVRKKPRKKPLRSAENKPRVGSIAFNLDKQAKLDAEKTKFQLNDRIKEQTAQMKVLNAEIETLRTALVEEAAAADAGATREEEEKRSAKLQLDVKQRSDARRALFGAMSPGTDSAFTKSLGTMHEAIEDADIRVLNRRHFSMT